MDDRNHVQIIHDNGFEEILQQPDGSLSVNIPGFLTGVNIKSKNNKPIYLTIHRERSNERQ